MCVQKEIRDFWGIWIDIKKVGIMNPETVPKEYITSGMVGYVFTNMKSAAEAR